MFDEQMEKSVTESKGEVEAFIQNKLNAIAESAIASRTDEFQNLESPINMEHFLEDGELER